ncbi:LytTR family DNA-binding domain-containing protein [Mangrovibacterium marinum]|nr:LytTR family DNA-binding domain-containing protein [Mangrovibacterium marinum]
MDQKLTILIVDSEQDDRDILRNFLLEVPIVGRVEEASTTEEALFKFIATNPDIVLLDNLMPGRDGTELIQLFKGKAPNCLTIITSSRKDSAIIAIQNGIYDFILKPADLCHLQERIELFHKQQQASIDKKIQQALSSLEQNPKLRISTTNNHILINPDDIVYIEADGAYSTMYLQNGSKEVANTYLGKLEKILSKEQFFRLSRSTIINLHKLSQVNRVANTCTVVGTNFEVSLSGSRRQIKILCEMDLN